MGSKTSFYVLEALMLAYRLARVFSGLPERLLWLIASVVLQTCIAGVLDTECNLCVPAGPRWKK